MKKTILTVSLCSILNLQAGIFSNNEATFDDIYPTPFYKTTSGKYIIGGIAIAGVTVATIMTGGAAAVPGATSLGALFGTTWTGALATLGGGSLASGGFGMAGGAMVLGVTTDATIMGLQSFIPEDNYHGKYTMIKIPLPEVGSKKVLKIYSLIDKTKEEYQDGIISKSTYENIIYTYYNDVLNNIDSNNPYDLINKAIIEFNLGKYNYSLRSINNADYDFKVKSYIYYHKALLALAMENDTDSAIFLLKKTISEENDKLKPYILLIQIYIDNNQFYKALDITKQGLNNFDDDSFELNWLAGNLTYKLQQYNESIEYYKNALSNITINKLEAECKVSIANSYYHLYNYKKARQWYEDALSEVADAPYRQNIQQMYLGK
jgi:hypothetical protein